MSHLAPGLSKWVEALDKKWTWSIDPLLPRQTSAVDCGIWVILTALDILYGRAWSFSQASIEDRRLELGLRYGIVGHTPHEIVAAFTGTIDGVWEFPPGVQEAPGPSP